MTNMLIINGGTAIPVSNVRRIRPVTDDDRARITKHTDYVEDAAKFNTQIQFADRSQKLATDTVEQIRAQGIPLVNLGNETYVPAANIKLAQAFTEQDAANAKARNVTLSETFRSRVDTVAGQVLSSMEPIDVINAREKALAIAAGANRKTGAPKPAVA